MRFCANCGTRIEDSVQFCPACGSMQPQVNYQEPQANYRQPTEGYSAPPRISDWDGGVLDTVVAVIVTYLIVLFTCGFGTPWAVCYMWKFILDHATIDGERLTFDGTGVDLLGNWIKWFLLTLITCGIYSFWVMPRMIKWVASHTHKK